MSALTPQSANMWIERVFPGDFGGRDGIKSLLDYLSEHGGTCKMVDEDQTLSISALVGSKPARVIAFMMYRDERNFQVTFVNFRGRVPMHTLVSAANLLSVPGMINAVEAARQNDFRTKRKSLVSDVFPYAEKVGAIKSAYDLILNNQPPA